MSDPGDTVHGTAALSPARRRLPVVSLVPFGLASQKPRHFVEMAKTIWENRDALPYAYRVLTEGVCDGCALGTTGLHDWTLGEPPGGEASPATHLCLVRLGLLRTNTIGALDPAVLRDVRTLRGLDNRKLRALGRIPVPLRRRRGEDGFTPVSWDEALGDLGGRLRAADPDRVAAFVTSRGIGNEVYYAVQKVMRRLGSPHVDNAARLCHSPSTVAMRRMLGVSASTCSYRDWYGTDLVVLFGSNPANDQPVAMKYLLEAKQRGTRVLVVNPLEEPGLARYWVPSTPESALFGTRIADRFFRVRTGGDHAFLRAVTRCLVVRGAVREDFLAEHTEGWDAYRAALLRADPAALAAEAGVAESEVEALADELARAERAVFVWSMGLTQHAHGTATVEALLALGLARGYVGRAKCGLMPIRGHSGVQGGGEMGAYANLFPGGVPVGEEGADALAATWGFRPPARVGMDTAAMLDAAGRAELDVFYCIGGNFRDTMPQPRRVEESLARVPVRIHQDIVLTHAMLVPPDDVVYLLPARTRYESRGGITETTTERRVVFSPHVPGHEVGDAKEEWWIARALLAAARPEWVADLRFEDADGIRRDIARTIPAYAGIEHLRQKGDQFQWGGPRLCEGGVFPRPSGRAAFFVNEVGATSLAPSELRLSSRRGKQFNSMIQGNLDPITGASRDDVLVSAEDLRVRGLAHGDPVRVHSAHGSFDGRAFVAPIAPGNVQMFWPEANVLLDPTARDPRAHVPDYNVAVRLERRS